MILITTVKAVMATSLRRSLGEAMGVVWKPDINLVVLTTNKMYHIMIMHEWGSVKYLMMWVGRLSQKNNSELLIIYVNHLAPSWLMLYFDSQQFSKTKGQLHLQANICLELTLVCILSSPCSPEYCLASLPLKLHLITTPPPPPPKQPLSSRPWEPVYPTMHCYSTSDRQSRPE